MLCNNIIYSENKISISRINSNNIFHIKYNAYV